MKVQHVLQKHAIASLFSPDMTERLAEIGLHVVVMDSIIFCSAC